MIGAIRSLVTLRRCPHCQHYAPKYKKLAGEVTKLQPSVKFYAVSCVAHRDVCKAQEVKGYPTIKIYKGGSYEPAAGSVRNDAEAVLRELGLGGGGGDNKGGKKESKGNIRSGQNVSSSAVDGGSGAMSASEKEKARVVPFREHDVRDAWSDASTSFEFALRNGIYMENGPLSPEKSSALRDWLELLSKSLPGEMNRTHDVINSILADYGSATGGQSNLDRLVDGSLNSTNEDGKKKKKKWIWRTCTYGDNEMGYTCGLWQLFHIMSVGVVEYNEHNDDRIATKHASETLRNCEYTFFNVDTRSPRSFIKSTTTDNMLRCSHSLRHRY